MTDSLADQWKKEQQILVDLIHGHPSQDHTEARDRLALLNKLLADHAQNA